MTLLSTLIKAVAGTKNDVAGNCDEHLDALLVSLHYKPRSTPTGVPCEFEEAEFSYYCCTADFEVDIFKIPSNELGLHQDNTQRHSEHHARRPQRGLPGTTELNDPPCHTNSSLPAESSRPTKSLYLVP